jgi:hypothetical protein
MATGRKTGGRRKGSGNKVTANAREAIARFVDGNAKRLQGWLDEIAEEEGSKSAFACFVDLLEFHVPKLARTEMTGADGAPLAIQVVRYGDPSPEQLGASQLPALSVDSPGTGNPPSSPVLASPERKG